MRKQPWHSVKQPQRPRDEWLRPEFDLLSGKMREIGEIRFKADGKQFRVLGFFGPGRFEFTMLIGASKKGSNYDPKAALQSALDRKNDVDADRTGAVSVISEIGQKLLQKLRKKAYRDAYLGEHIRRGIAYQIRALRNQRDWNQGRLSALLGKPQSVVSRLEDPSYGKVTVQTLLELASVFDIALQIRFVSFSSFLKQTRNLDHASMEVESFDKDIKLSESAPSMVFASGSPIKPIVIVSSVRGEFYKSQKTIDIGFAATTSGADQVRNSVYVH